MPIIKLVKISPANVPLTPIAAIRSKKNINTNIIPTNFVTCIPNEKKKYKILFKAVVSDIVNHNKYRFHG